MSILQNAPKSIERRTFTCPGCGYSAQVYGEAYFDKAWCNWLSTFRCLDCNRVFEYFVSEIEKWEKVDELVHKLNDDVLCMNCGSRNVRAWTASTPECPACRTMMDCSVDGIIRLGLGG
jgi:hypothetical protein